jgi:hypothetical protein
VVSYECEIWSLTIGEEHRLRVLENRVLRGIFEPRRDEVTGVWRKLHNDEVHNLSTYSSLSINYNPKGHRMISLSKVVEPTVAKYWKLRG